MFKINKQFFRQIHIVLFTFSFVLVYFWESCWSQDAPIYDTKAIFHPVVATQGLVSTQEKLATQAGLEVLKEGGNAVDAAVTVGFVLAVTLPRAGNLGGGGFMLLHLTENNQNIAIDYREKAPLAATKDMFLNQQGEVDSRKSRYSHLAVGVPGTVAGLNLALEKYGTISLARALKPAIELAENGFIVTQDFYDSLLFAQKSLKNHPESEKIFLTDNGNPVKVGDLFIQTDLANSLKLISSQGKKAFYENKIADYIVAEMKNNDGIITKEDLKKYAPVIRKPVEGKYKDYHIYSMPPPSSGGIHLIQMLNILEPLNLEKWGHNSAKVIHFMAETMKLAYADRSKYLGDSDFVPVPIKSLISKDYAAKLRNKINVDKATPSQDVLPGNLLNFQGSNDTTHYSVIDKDGNAVANTYTLNFSYGSGITVPNTGILLNNEMDDFVAKPDVANAFGLTGGEFNAIAPEKRMLSSMSPTIVMKDGEVFLVTGSPGGSRIITTVLQIIINVINFQMNIAEATVAARFHHQWLPDNLYVEKEINQDTINLLKNQGHEVVKTRAMGSTQTVMKIDNFFYGFSDPRSRESLTIGY
jgi:gamma-glutamyltranspeptidase/glutathione hydrolase